MTAKEYLMQLRRMDRMINLNLERLGYWRDLSTRVSGCRYEQNCNPNRPTEAPFIKPLEKIMGLEEKMAGELEKFISFREHLTALISRIPDFDEREVMEMRYIDNLRWEDIADRCGYSQRWIYKLHGRGLRAFEEIMREEDVKKRAALPEEVL